MALLHPLEQERLTLLQAKMDGLLRARLENAAMYGHNIERIAFTRPDSSPPVQGKLTIWQSGDKYEQEADETATQVVQRIHQQSNQPVQREAVTEEEELQTKPVDHIQRQELSVNEELQMKSMVQTVADGGMAASADVEAGIQQARGGGQPLADSVREPMEQAFGADFGGVRIHTDATSDKLNKSIQARAFTTEQDIFFGQGEYSPGSNVGKELLAHELTHVVQQSGGAIQPKVLHSAPKENKIHTKETVESGQFLMQEDQDQGLQSAISSSKSQTVKDDPPKLQDNLIASRFGGEYKPQYISVPKHPGWASLDHGKIGNIHIPGLPIELPHTLKVDLVESKNDKSVVIIREGKYSEQQTSPRLAHTIIKNKYLGTTPVTSGTASVTFIKGKRGIDPKTKYEVRFGKLYYGGNGPVDAITQSTNEVPDGTHNLEIPDFQHSLGSAYGDYGTTWFRIGNSGDRYLHPGSVSLGCATVKQTSEWANIWRYLIKSRQDHLNVGTIKVEKSKEYNSKE